MVAPASRGSFRASRPKLTADAGCRCLADCQPFSICRGNSAGRRIEPAGGGCYPQLLSSLNDPRLPSQSFSRAGAQILFQPGEGLFKRVVVLPVRNVGDVIFPDFFRQIFTGVRVQALPFFQCLITRQRAEIYGASNLHTPSRFLSSLGFLGAL